MRNSIEAAKTRVEAGRATLRAVEGDVFTEAVAAYMDVIRDRAIVELNNNQVRVLTTNLEATRDRFEIGDITRTDVAQSEARLSLARADLATVQGRLSSSEENYRRVIGRRPDALQPPPPLPPLPTSPDQAVQIALANNPDLIAITRQAAAAAFDVRTARASRLPTVSAVASGDYSKTLNSQSDPLLPDSPTSGTATTVGVSGRIPIYQGGLPAARIRQAQAIEGQTLEQRIATERAVVANTRSAFATYTAAQNAIASNQVAVSANELALEGARAENSVGTRTILDVLNAEQELLNAQVQLVTRAARCLCRGLPIAQRHGAGRGRRPRARRRAALRSARQLSQRRGQLERLGGRAAPRAGRDAHRDPAGGSGDRGAARGRDSGAAIGDRQAMAAAREPSMEDILASIKRVIAEEKEIRAAAPPPLPAGFASDELAADDDVLELEEVVEEELAPADRPWPAAADRGSRRRRAATRLEELASVAAAAPPPAPAANPLEELVREMLRPILKQWLDDYLPHVVDEHVKREIHRITGKPV